VAHRQLDVGVHLRRQRRRGKYGLAANRQPRLHAVMDRTGCRCENLPQLIDRI
jgi:hypothetical protein